MTNPISINLARDKKIASDTTKKKNFDPSELTELKVSLSDTEEKINSLNIRIDDFYIFSGIIITLLLAINISVYVKAEGDVEKHLRQNFEEHQKKIQQYVDEAQVLVGKLKSDSALASKLRQELQKGNQTEPQNDNNDVS